MLFDDVTFAVHSFAVRCVLVNERSSARSLWVSDGSLACMQGTIRLTEWADLGEAMSHVDGAVVVVRPDLTNTSRKLAPAGSLHYVKTLASYFPIFKTSLLPGYVRRVAFGSRSMNRTHAVCRQAI